MTDKYPLPSYAVSVWAAGDNLMVAFPATIGERGHTIKLPLSGAGLKTALAILKDRSEATDLRIAQRGTPTQYEVENDQRYKALVKARAADAAATQAERDEAVAFLEELGL
jgi:hypothetical protein